MNPTSAARLPRWVRGRQVGVTYAVLVLTVTLVLHALPAATTEHVVQQASTNLVNLRQQPLAVLGASAFVLGNWVSLLELPILVLAYGAVQRWLGWCAAVVAGVLGHVGATLFVAVILVTGIARGDIALRVATVTDVGVSYGMASIGGLLTARVHRRWLPAYLTGALAYLAYGFLHDRSFTALGHATAFAIGASLTVFTQRDQ